MSKYVTSVGVAQSRVAMNLERRKAWLKRHGLKQRHEHDPRRAPVGRTRGFVSWLDHVEAFSTGERPVFVTQPYVYDRAEIESFCRAHEFVVFVSKPAESWHLPDGAFLLIAVPGELSSKYVEREQGAK